MPELLKSVLLYLALFLLLALSAFFSGSEIGIAKANRRRLEKRAEEGDKRSRLAVRIMDRFNEMISTILVANNLMNIAFTSVITVLATTVWFPRASEAVTEAVVTVGGTLLILIFGEIFPKILCTEYADAAARRSARPLRFFYILFAPAVKSAAFIMKRLSRLWTPKEAAPTATIEELGTIVEEIEDEGVFTEKESELIRSAIEFSETTAREVMIPRVDVAGFDLENGSAEDLLHDKDLLSYGRIPVYRESLDNVVGILPVKRFIRAMLTDPETDIESLLLEPTYVHMTRTISSILSEFRREHRQMALVIDEYGGTMGILTLEDIVEEIVGEIFDERDDVEQDVIRRGGTFEVAGDTNIYDCFEDIGFEDPDFESAYTTVGGWATEVLDKFPEKGDSFTYKNLSVTVLDAEDLRVEKLLIEVRDPETADEEEKDDGEKTAPER